MMGPTDCLTAHLVPLWEVFFGKPMLPSPARQHVRPETARVRGHRFSTIEAAAPAAEPEAAGAKSPRSSWPDLEGPRSPLSSADGWPTEIDAAPAAPPPSAAHILLIDPGSGEACGALQRTHHVHLAVGPEFDLQVKRYPPHWQSMCSVKLTVAEAEAAAATFSLPSGTWPSASTLRGPAHPQNLATWASEIYREGVEGAELAAVHLSETRADRASARHLQPMWSASERFCCLVCGSRGGEVTLPALWLLGCRLPAVVINAGCAREKAAWVWPAGVPVVLVTGGRDQICNEFFQAADDERDRLYVARVWAAVPAPNRATTALVHLPCMSHRASEATLGAVLPALVEYAAAGLALASAPEPARLGKVPCLLVTEARPEGEWLVSLPPAERPIRPTSRKNRASWEGLLPEEVATAMTVTYTTGAPPPTEVAPTQMAATRDKGRRLMASC